MIYALTLLIQVASIAAIGYVYLGHEYMTAGWGLHPMLSGALALSLIATPYVLAWYLDERRLDALYELQAEHEKDNWPQYMGRYPDDATQAKIDADWLRLHPVPPKG